MTYIKEQQIWGWHRHDFYGGFVENVCSIPNGDEDAVYFTIKRTINGETKRYVEILNSRRIDDIVECIFMDSAITHDGRNFDESKTMELTGSGWTYKDSLTLTCSSPEFSASSVGNGINFYGPLGEILRLEIISFASSTVVTVRPNKTVPVNMQAIAFNGWAYAINVIGGLWNIEGKNVSIFADGYVVASPNNSAYKTIYTVINGQITLDKNYGVIQVGIPFVSDLETLDIDMANAPTISTYNKHINQVALRLYQSRGFFAGAIFPEEDPGNITAPPTHIDPLTNLFESKMRNYETENEPIVLTDDVVKVNIASSWNNNGRVAVRNVDPIPLSILSIVPSGDVPSGR